LSPRGIVSATIAFMFFKKSLNEYLVEYARDHAQLGTKLTHMVGIPLIVASLPVMPLNPPLGGAMFVGGWALQFIGHYVFEKNDPKFFGDPANLVIGVVWAGMEWAEVFGVHIPGLPTMDELATDHAVAA
jgi:uncharacterized membrane protein YGL010W